MACTVLLFVSLACIPTQLVQRKLAGLASLGDGELFFLHGEKVFVEVIRDRRAWIDAGTGNLSVLPTHETSPYFSLGDADSTRPG